MKPSLLYFPCLYLGDRATKTVDIPGRHEPVTFEQREGYELPVAFLTEMEGRALERRATNLFRFQPPSANEATSHLQAQIDALTERLDALEGKPELSHAVDESELSPTVAETVIRRTRKPKAELEAISV